jgi:hypothetical protein
VIWVSRRLTGISGATLLAIVCCSMVDVPVSSNAAPTSEVEVVDAFVRARTAVDQNAMRGLLHEDLQIVDLRYGQASGIDSLHQLLPLGEMLELGARQLSGQQEVTWTEKVLQSARPKWETSLDASVDDITASTAILRLYDDGATSGPMVSPSYMRAMRAIVVRSKIAVLVIASTADQQGHPFIDDVGRGFGRFLVVLAITAILGCTALLFRSASARHQRAGDLEMLSALDAWVVSRRR